MNDKKDIIVHKFVSPNITIHCDNGNPTTIPQNDTRYMQIDLSTPQTIKVSKKEDKWPKIKARRHKTKVNIDSKEKCSVNKKGKRRWEVIPDSGSYDFSLVISKKKCTCEPSKLTKIIKSIFYHDTDGGTTVTIGQPPQ